MKFYVAFLLLLGSLISITHMAFADPSPQPSAAPISISVQPPMQPSVVAVAEPAAPPVWAQDVMVSAQKLPVIGPVVAKAMLYLGILSALLTSLAAFVLSALAILQKAFSYAGLANAATAIVGFQNGKFMYYLKFLSSFNAQKPASPEAQA